MVIIRTQKRADMKRILAVPGKTGWYVKAFARRTGTAAI